MYYLWVNTDTLLVPRNVKRYIEKIRVDRGGDSWIAGKCDHVGFVLSYVSCGLLQSDFLYSSFPIIDKANKFGLMWDSNSCLQF